MIENEIDATIAAALAAGAVSDGETLPSRKESATPAQTKPAGYMPNYEPKDPYFDPRIRDTASQPYGLLIMEDRHAKGLCSDAELEATRFFWGEPKEHILRETDPTKALEVLKVFGERKIVPEEQIDQLAREIAELEIDRHKRESARIQEEARQEKEQAEQEALELRRKEAIQERIFAAYSTTHREMLGPPEGE